MAQRYQSEKLAEGTNAYLDGLPNTGHRELEDVAHAALNRCGISAAERRLAGQMGNFGYGDTSHAVLTGTPEPSFLLTLHVPYDGFPPDEVHREVETMYAWLADLDRSTTIDLQTPIEDADGRLCQIHQLPNGLPVVCTVQRWVPGQDLVKDGEPVELDSETLASVGRMLRQVHAHGAEWARSTTPQRIRPDPMIDVAEVGTDTWGSRKERNATSEELALLERTVSQIVQARESSREPWGMAHGDFRATNCVEFEGQIKPIDFDLCTLTYQFDDLGWFLRDLKNQESCKVFLDGYHKAGPEIPEIVRQVEGAFIIAQIRGCAWGGPFPERLVVDCERFLVGKEFLLR